MRLPTQRKRLCFFYDTNKMWLLYLKDFQRFMIETYDTESKPTLPGPLHWRSKGNGLCRLTLVFGACLYKRILFA